jgi:hypothetical protein
MYNRGHVEPNSSRLLCRGTRYWSITSSVSHCLRVVSRAGANVMGADELPTFGLSMA